jgi:hypothetical protein
MEVITSVTNKIISIARSAMTRDTNYTSLIKKEIGYFVTLQDIDENTISIVNREIDDFYTSSSNDLTEDDEAQIIERLIYAPHTISVSISYNFGPRPGKKRYIPEWYSIFDPNQGGYDGWKRNVIDRLHIWNYPFIWIESDSDLGSQTFTIYLSRVEKML